VTLRARIRKIEARLAVPADGRRGRVPGYATQAERHGKQRRLQVLRARLAEAERRLDAGRVSVCRGGRALLRKRNSLASVGLTAAQWRERWESARLFLTADGEAGKLLGNETIRWHPGEGWLEIKLPAPLSHLANGPHGRYRLSCLDGLRGHRLLAVDLNHDHLAAWIVTPDGNPAGPSVMIPLQLAGLPVGQRDGRLRAAISGLLRIAREHGCAAVAVEDLSFTDAREQGRERTGGRPSRGKRGRGWRRLVAGIPTGKFRDRLTQMAANAGLAVIAVDPAYTSRWGTEHWLAPLREQDTVTTGHHAAAVVIGRRAQGQRARRREGVTSGGQRTARRRAAPTAPAARSADRNGRPRKAQRQPPRWRKTATANRARPPDQAAHDRSGPPAERPLPLSV
jgi:hypothetical protein